MSASAPSPDEALAHAEFVRAMARSVLGRDDAVEDAVQETWLAAMRSGPRDRASMRAWLGSVARNAAISIRRATSRRAARERAAARAEALPSPARIAEVEDARRRLVHAVLALDEPYRSTLLLRYYTGLSPADVAEAQGVPQETVRTRLQRGLTRLRERFASDHGGDRRSAALALLPLAFPDGVPPPPIPWAEVLVVKKVAAAVVALLVVGLGVGWSVAWIGADAADERPAGSPDAAASESAAASLGAARSGSAVAASSDAAARAGSSDRFPLSGVVVDADGKPVAGARVWAARRFAGDVPANAALTDAAGRFTAEGARGEHLFASADGFCVAEATAGRAGVHGITLFRTVGRVRGRVLDGEGRPIAGALVVVGSWQGRARTYTRSEVDGRFNAPGTPPFWGTEVTVSASGFLSAHLTVPPDLDGGAGLVVRLERAGFVTGRVLDAGDGTPIEGASVLIAGESGHETSTDAEGRFRLESDVGGRGKAQVRATAKDRRPEVVDVFTGSAASIELRLERLVELEGRVVAADGRPAAGAEVLRWGTDPGGVADAEGRVRLSSRSPSATVPLVLLARIDRSAVGFAVVVDRTPFEIRLAPAAAAVGTVTDADGTGVAGALVQATWRRIGQSDATATSVSMGAGFGWGNSIATDADGGFRVDGLPAGSLSLRVDRPGSDRALATWFGNADLRAGETTEVTLGAARGRTLTGVVVDDTGLSLPFVEVMGDGDRALSGSDGRFVLHVKPADPTAATFVSVQADGYSSRVEQVLPDAGDLRVVVRRDRAVRLRLAGAVPPDGTVVHVAIQAATDTEGHGSWAAVAGSELVFSGVSVDAMRVFVRTPISAGGPVDVSAAPGTGLAIGTLRLEPTTTISGVVVDDAEHAVRGAAVHLTTRDSGPISMIGWDAVSANDGAFVVDGVPAGSSWLVTATATGMPQSPPREVAAGAKDVRIVLARSATIAGRVVADGPPAVALRVESRRPGGTSWNTAFVDADGRFRFENVPAGQHLLKVGRGGRESPEQPVDALPEGSTDVVLHAPDVGLSIRGQFVDGAGSPMKFPSIPPWLSVMAGSKGGGVLAPADASGRFEAIGLEPGDYELSASGFGGHALQKRVAAGTQDLALRWWLDGAVDGRVVLPHGASIERVAVSLVPVGSPMTSAGGTDTAGDRFLIRVAPGRYRVLARAGPFVRVSDEVVEVVESGAAHAADVVLAVGGSVAGVVRSAGGAPVARARVFLLARGGTIAFDGRADEQGSYRVEGVPAGDYDAVLGNSSSRTPVSVTAGSTATLDLVAR